MKTLRIISLAILTMILVACGDKSEDTIVVATTPDNPPYAFIDNGEVVGLDIDIVKAIGYHLGKKVVIKQMDFHRLFGAVGAKSVDMAIAGLSITTDRKQRVDFSDTYTSATVAVIYRKTDNLKEALDLKGKMIGAKLGTVLGQVAQDLAIRLEARVKTLADNNLLLKELQKGLVDVVIIEEAQAESFSNSNPNLAYFILEDLSSDFAIALPKNSLLKVSIDNAIRVLETEGVFDSIREKWLRTSKKRDK